MAKVNLPDNSAAESFLAQIRERKQGKDKAAPQAVIENVTEPEESVQAPPDKAQSAEKAEKKKSSPNRLVIPKPIKKESKAETITFRITKSLKTDFQKKCEQEGVTQNYILEQLIEIWVKT
ncbi:hypothetical protein LJC74_01965 [Eubacteriales bacterium OttesenSCG-928-A19]|nr:hypothetical protein [Eubacteriales bacterium OttesenSCG-928-A19]